MVRHHLGLVLYKRIGGYYRKVIAAFYVRNGAEVGITAVVR